MSVRLFYARFTPLLLLLLAAGLFPVAVTAQVLYNSGATLMVQPGATLFVSGDYEQVGSARLYNEGTMQVAGRVTGDFTSDIDLRTGSLEVTGDVTQQGTFFSTPTGRLVLTGRTNQNLSAPRGNIGGLVVDKPVPGADTLRLQSLVSASGHVDLRNGMVSGMVGGSTQGALFLQANTGTLTGETSGRFVQGVFVSYRTNVTGNQPIDLYNGVILHPNGQNMGTVYSFRFAGMKQREISYAENPTNPANRSIDQAWAISNTTTLSTPVSLTLKWLADNDNGLPFADFAHATAWCTDYATTPPIWIPYGPYQDARSRSITLLTDNLTRTWTVATAAAPLPVELISFDATRAGPAARLTWATASESNSAYFEVETSITGHNFRPVTAIGRIAAHGTSTERHLYSALDPALLTYSADPVYYRLRQVDLDGTTTYSEVRALRIGDAQPIKLTAILWPNPSVASTRAQLHLTLPTTAPVELTLLDAVGRVVRQQVVTPVAPGAQTFVVPGAETDVPLAAGVYLVQVRQGAETVTQRLLRE